MAIKQSRLESENLEAHVDLCAARYRVLEDKLDKLEIKVDDLVGVIKEMSDQQTADKVSGNKLIFGAAATVVAGLLSTIVLLMLNLGGGIAPAVVSAVGG